MKDHYKPIYTKKSDFDYFVILSAIILVFVYFMVFILPEIAFDYQEKIVIEHNQNISNKNYQELKNENDL